MAKLLLAGYFGAGNLGDDAILKGFAEGLGDTPYQYRALAGSAERLMRNLGIPGVPRMDLGSVKNAISECDALVFPGGSIFQDVTSTKSVAYYSGLVKEAKKAKKKVILLGQGVGPLNGFLGKRMAAAAFNAADMIAVRDPGSVSVLRSLGVKGTPRVTADCAFLLPVPPKDEASTSFGVAGMKTIGISVRPWGKKNSKEVVRAFADLVMLLSKNGYVPVLMPMDAEEDAKVIDEIAKLHGGKVPDLKGLATPAQFQQRVGRMEAVIAMRLHAGILAATVGIPPMMVSYDPKVTAFSNLIGLPAPPNVQGVTGDRLFAQFQSFVKDREPHARTVERRLGELKAAAGGNIQALRDCLGA